MRVLVTGGAGFIGSHVVDMLVQQGHDVLVIDNLVTGCAEYLNPKAEFIKLDIADSSLAQVLASFRPSAVIHQAAQVSLPASLAQPLADAQTNILGTLNLLTASQRVGVKRVVYASTAAVYGEPCYLPIDEGHPLRGVSPYGVSKRAAERYLEVFRKLYNLDYTVLRYANVYGPRQSAQGEGGVVAKFVHSIKNGQPPVIFGDGRQTRDFVYVQDVAAANVAALAAVGSQVLNVSTGLPTTINQLWALVNSAAGQCYKPCYAPARQGDVLHSYLANAAIKQQLHWYPRWSLEQGLASCY